MPFRKWLSLFYLGLCPWGGAPKLFKVQNRRGIATASHQAAEPLHLLSAYCLLITVATDDGEGHVVD
jgi:hypothetical protein